MSLYGVDCGKSIKSVADRLCLFGIIHIITLIPKNLSTSASSAFSALVKNSRFFDHSRNAVYDRDTHITTRIVQKFVDMLITFVDSEDMWAVIFPILQAFSAVLGQMTRFWEFFAPFSHRSL